MCSQGLQVEYPSLAKSAGLQELIMPPPNKSDDLVNAGAPLPPAPAQGSNCDCFVLLGICAELFSVCVCLEAASSAGITFLVGGAPAIITLPHGRLLELVANLEPIMGTLATDLVRSTVVST